ncbi:MAG: VOC family protein [Micrococcus sp.]|nr:VOC family protein [Micrococcus sp.]
MKITQAFLIVNDQDKAKAFYTDVLGLEVETDYSGEGFRWLSLRAPGQEGGASLVLSAPSDGCTAFQREMREKGMPIFSFDIANDAEFEAIRDRGATVLMEPTQQQYGGTDALIDDTVGNIICLHQN